MGIKPRDRAEGQGWTVSADSTVVRAHQHAAGARRALPAELARGGGPFAQVNATDMLAAATSGRLDTEQARWAVPRLPGLAPGSAEGRGGGSLASIFEARPLARELHRSGRC